MKKKCRNDGNLFKLITLKYIKEYENKYDELIIDENGLVCKRI